MTWLEALDLATGMLLPYCGPRNTNVLFRDRLSVLDVHYPAALYTRLDVVVDHDKSHQAMAGEPWLPAHPRVPWLFWPTSCPQANPIERACDDVHDCCTRHHRHQRVPNLVADVEAHLHVTDPWLYKLSELYDEPAMTAAVDQIAAAEQCQVAA